MVVKTTLMMGKTRNDMEFNIGVRFHWLYSHV